MFIGFIVLFISLMYKNQKSNLFSLNNRLEDENITTKYKYYRERLYQILENKNITIYYKTTLITNKKDKF
jgi:hypothetical protein